MATSQSNSYNKTRDELIRSACELVGIAVKGEPLDPTVVSVAEGAFNNIVQSWKSYGLHLWKKGSASVTMVAGTAKYTLAPTLGAGTEKPMRLYSVDLTDSDGNQTPLTRLSHQEYNDLSNLTTAGNPVNFYFEPQRTTSVMYVWPVPNATTVADYTLNYTYQQPLQDHDVGTEDVDFPTEWYRALTYTLAYDLGFRYGIDLNTHQMLGIQAQDSLDLALSYDVEDTSLHIHPDTRGYC